MSYINLFSKHLLLILSFQELQKNKSTKHCYQYNDVYLELITGIFLLLVWVHITLKNVELKTVNCYKYNPFNG